MLIGHYVKRELETLFVHRFSNATMPFFNIFKNSSHYYLLCGFNIMYFFMHPLYTQPEWADRQATYVCVGFFCFFEFMNLMCHITQMNLRTPGTKERKIPHGWGFDQISCANYFWESLSWLTFAIYSQCFGAYLFWLVSTAQMLDWALKKHRNYKKEFPNYPKGRKAMFPLLI